MSLRDGCELSLCFPRQFLSPLIYQRAIRYYGLFHAFFPETNKSPATSRFFLSNASFFYSLSAAPLKLSELSRSFNVSARFTRPQHFFEKANQSVFSNGYSTICIAHKTSCSIKIRAPFFFSRESHAEEDTATMQIGVMLHRNDCSYLFPSLNKFDHYIVIYMYMS